MTRKSWDRHIEVDLRAPLVLTQAFAEQLPAGAEGVVVNMLDQRVKNLTPNLLSYSVSKMGLWGATQVLARQLAPRIRVNAIGPGPALKPAEGQRRGLGGARAHRCRCATARSPDEIAAPCASSSPPAR